jgi:hypothetical protein
VPAGQSLLEFRRTEKRAQIHGHLLVGLDLTATRGSVVPGQILALEKSPAGLRQERRVITFRFDELRPVLHRPRIGNRREAGGDGDDRKDHAPTGADDTAAGRENAALVRQATEHVAMTDRIEAGIAERQPGAVGECDPAGAGEPLPSHPLAGDAKTREGQIDQDDVTTRSLGQVKTGPARARADLQEAITSFELQEIGDMLGLRAGGPARSPVVAAADLALDRHHHRRQRALIELIEAPALVLLARVGGHARVPWIGPSAARQSPETTVR